MPDARLQLVVDNIQAKELQVSLTNLGYQVAGNITDEKLAIESIARLQPDLVLISIHLNGELGGVSLGKKIYEQFDLPIIYISDQSSQATVRRSNGNAHFGYLFNPTDEKQILATVEVALARHSMEKKVRESEQWLYAILHSISDGLITVDMEEHIRFINPVAEELIGKQRISIIDQRLEDVFPIFYINTDERVTISHAMAFFRDKNQRTGFEAILLQTDNKRIPIEIFVSPLTNKDVQVGLVLAFRDISERKQYLEEIRRHASRSQALLEAARKLNTRLDVKAVLNTVCEICNNSLNTSITSAFINDPSRNTLISATIAVNTNEDNICNLEKQSFAKKYKIPTDFFANLFSEAKPIVVFQDIQAIDMPVIPYVKNIKDYDIRSVAISGIYHNHTLTGILVAQTHGKIRDFSQGDLELLRGLTDHASIAVGNAILFEQVLASRERQQALTRRLVGVQEEERRALARELHDEIGQMMTGLQFSMSSLLPRATNEQKESIAEIQKTISNLIAQTREISMNLRPSMLDDTGLVLTLLWHFERYTSKTGIKINFQHYNLIDKHIAPEIETTIFRIIQEALTNVARHAKTDSVEVLIKLEDQSINVNIIDHGQGFDLWNVDYSAHMGLSSMRERAYAVGGLLEIATTPGSGTHIQVIIPLFGKIERRQNDRNRIDR